MRNTLRVLRAERDWSQTDLADALGVSRQTVHAIEADKYDPSLPLAFRIAGVFGQRIEEIFFPDPEKGEAGEGTEKQDQQDRRGGRLRSRDRGSDRGGDG